MAFLYSVIGDNTIENREHLEKLGYKSLRFFQGKKYLYATTCQRANAKEVWNEPYYGTVDDVDFYVSCGFIPIPGSCSGIQHNATYRHQRKRYTMRSI